MRSRIVRPGEVAVRALGGVALTAVAALAAACGQGSPPAQADESASVRTPVADADRDAQRAKELEAEASRLDTEAAARLHAGDLAFLDGDVSAGRDHYIAAGRLYESAAQARRDACDVATGVRLRWDEDTRRRTASRECAKGR
jgi:hypothetical protein